MNISLNQDIDNDREQKKGIAETAEWLEHKQAWMWKNVKKGILLDL